ncbi:HalOD1 output domain-containing protein [Haloarcula litorea]|uniref:HalOD1 output domain-containing protein n=1 Tax=Haloarcula litorea TaxID=3032579 RepID=UPI0023E8F625|nr:HalOD1 output domain-containing protein [Halomicroarcula sp. GDY20]
MDDERPPTALDDTADPVLDTGSLGRTRTDLDSGVTVAEFDGEATPTLAILELVGTRSRRAIPELPPLAETIDPEALDTLCDGTADVCVRFDYAGYRVRVEGGSVALLPDS